jgi:hypothetical protein
MMLLLQQLATSVCSMFYYLAYDIDAACVNGDVQHFDVGESHSVEVTVDAATAVVTAVAQAMVQHPAAEDLQVSTHVLLLEFHYFAIYTGCSRACAATASDRTCSVV